jgi:serine/threonine protein kinase
MSMTQDMAVYAIIFGSMLALVIFIIAVAVGRRRRKRIIADQAEHPGRGTPEGRMLSQYEQLTPIVEHHGDVRTPARVPELVVEEGPLSGQRFPILSDGLKIGRHPGNDIVLSDELMVSRHHAIIEREHGHFVLYDRDSVNGTWVNEQRIFRHALRPGDRIQIWQSIFVLTAANGSVPTPPVTPADPQPAALAAGEAFAGYRLLSLIGRGGMSQVFKAEDPHNRTVAIKILQQTDPYLVNKFVQEGNEIGPLLRSHPNIIYVHKFGQSPDNRLYIIMEFVDAPSLRKAMRGALGEPDTMQIMEQVCNALSFAHRKNIVHRDIKPENILLAANGKAKVLDFGIAKLTSAATVTRDKVVGTPEYISPEQALGEPVGPASDVYSLGIMLYEMLTGRVPFRRPPSDDPGKGALEVIRQHLKGRPPPMAKTNPGARISPKLEKVTMRALSKDARARYASAGELAKALGCQKPAPDPVSPSGPRWARLTIVQGPRQGQHIELTQGVLALGRGDLGSTNSIISRHHVNIIFRGDRYWLQDTSKNGTWVDNQPVYGELPLKPGSWITIGDNVLRLETE